MSHGKESCATCRFMVRGFCHRLSPVIVVHGDMRLDGWPETYTDEWCGEYKEIVVPAMCRLHPDREAVDNLSSSTFNGYPLCPACWIEALRSEESGADAMLQFEKKVLAATTQPPKENT